MRLIDRTAGNKTKKNLFLLKDLHLDMTVTTRMDVVTARRDCGQNNAAECHSTV